MIIDKQGRIFGKLNIIDALFIIFFIGLMLLIWQGIRIYRKSQILFVTPVTVTITEKEYDELKTNLAEKDKIIIELQKAFTTRGRKQKQVFEEHPRMKKYFE